MASSSIQFHADPDELVHELLRKWVGAIGGIHSAVEVLGDSGWRIGTGLPQPQGEQVSRVLLKTEPFVSGPISGPEFLRSNAGFLGVNVGWFDGAILRESQMSTVASDGPISANWARVLRKARRDLRRGAVLIDVRGNPHPAGGHLYTDGAVILQSRGVAMLAVAGSVRYVLNHVSAV